MKLKTRRPEPGPILSYLSMLPQAQQTEIQARLTDLFETPDGVILLNLLEKAVQDRVVPIQSDPRASEYLNVQRLIITDLQQITRSDDEYLDTKPHSQKSTR